MRQFMRYGLRKIVIVCDDNSVGARERGTTVMGAEHLCDASPSGKQIDDDSAAKRSAKLLGQPVKFVATTLQERCMITPVVEFRRVVQCEPFVRDCTKSPNLAGKPPELAELPNQPSPIGR